MLQQGVWIILNNYISLAAPMLKCSLPVFPLHGSALTGNETGVPGPRPAGVRSFVPACRLKDPDPVERLRGDRQAPPGGLRPALRGRQTCQVPRGGGAPWRLEHGPVPQT